MFVIVVVVVVVIVIGADTAVVSVIRYFLCCFVLSSDVLTGQHAIISQKM